MEKRQCNIMSWCIKKKKTKRAYENETNKDKENAMVRRGREIDAGIHYNGSELGEQQSHTST